MKTFFMGDADSCIQVILSKIGAGFFRLSDVLAQNWLLGDCRVRAGCRLSLFYEYNARIYTANSSRHRVTLATMILNSKSFRIIFMPK
jgi:hypothetical protein